MTYRIDFTPAARRQFRKLAPEIRRRLAPLIDGLAKEPRPKGAARLTGLEHAWRLRHGDYRIIYEVHEDRLANGSGDPSRPPARRILRPELRGIAQHDHHSPRLEKSILFTSYALGYPSRAS